MSTVPEPVSKVGRVAFELERFELLGGDCCEVQGRWFGVRGRRFMRPALTVLVDGQPTRLLADLAHKPWAAEDGELWKAAFPCPPESAELLDAELTVAPDITIALPTHEGRMVSGKQKLGRRRPEPLRTHSNRRAGGGSGVGDREAVERPEPAQRRPRAAGNRALSSQLAALTQELADARAEQGRLRSALDRAEAEKAGAAARIDELLGDLARAVRERDEAQRARDRMAAERDELRRGLHQVAADRGTAQGERDDIAAERDAAQRAGDEAYQASEAAAAARDRALAERDAALGAHARAVSERDAAVAARDQAAGERDALARANEVLQAKVANFSSARGAALVMRRAAQDGPAFRPHASLLPRGVAIIVLLAIVAVLLLVLHVA